jgi:DNA-binding transcriptional ArsR family regulator
MADIRNVNLKVKARVEKYLKRDKSGIRRAVLKLILRLKRFTTDSIYKALKKINFEVSKKSVAAIIGAIESRLGILKSIRNHSSGIVVYELKKEYIHLLRTILQS